MKTVGKRKPAHNFEVANILLKTVIELRGNKPFVPRGLYRFKSFNEAQKWFLKMITRKTVKN